MKELSRDQTPLVANKVHRAESGMNWQLPLIQGIINKILSSQPLINQFDKEDLAQETIKAVVKFKPNQISDLSEKDWWYLLKKILARKQVDLYRHNKISRLSSAIDEDFPRSIADQVAGNTDYEAWSAAVPYWKSIKKLSLEKKFVMLLENDVFHMLVIKLKVCTLSEIAAALKLNSNTIVYFLEVLNIEPKDRTNIDVGKAFERCYSKPLNPAQVSRCRYDAVAELKQLPE